MNPKLCPICSHPFMQIPCLLIKAILALGLSFSFLLTLEGWAGNEGNQKVPTVAEANSSAEAQMNAAQPSSIPDAKPEDLTSWSTEYNVQGEHYLSAPSEKEL